MKIIVILIAKLIFFSGSVSNTCRKSNRDPGKWWFKQETGFFISCHMKAWSRMSTLVWRSRTPATTEAPSGFQLYSPAVTAALLEPPGEVPCGTSDPPFIPHWPESPHATSSWKAFKFLDILAPAVDEGKKKNRKTVLMEPTVPVTFPKCWFWTLHFPEEDQEAINYWSYVIT